MPGVGGFGFFEFTLVGIPAAGRDHRDHHPVRPERLLPERSGATMPADFSRHATTLVEQYGLAERPLPACGCAPPRRYVGQPAVGIDLAALSGDLQLVAAQDGDRRPPLRRPDGRGRLPARSRRRRKRPPPSPPTCTSRSARRRAARGRGDAVQPQLRPGRGDDPAALGADRRDGLSRHGHRERRPRSSSPCSARARTLDAGRLTLRAGDTLLLQGTWKALDVQLNDPRRAGGQLARLVRRQAVPLGPGAKQAIAVLLGMVFLLATGLVPPAIAGLLARRRAGPVRVLRSSNPTAPSTGRRSSSSAR